MKLHVKLAVTLVSALVAVLIFAGRPLLRSILAGNRPSLQLNVDNAVPRQVDDSVQQAIVRDYSAAWQSLESALANNTAGALKDDFIGFALDKLTQRVKDQQQSGLRTRIVDRGHKVDAIFYSLDGSAIELRDTVMLDTEILDGNTVLHAEHAQVQYFAVMTGAEDRWKVRVLESTKAVD
jgi:hypothetical protein